MKHQLADWMAELELPKLDEGSTRKLGNYVDWLLEANTRLNLTAVTDPQEAWRLHILDSLVALPEVDDAPAGSLLDIGTGGGLPGLPLAIATGRRTLLLDSVGKKASAICDFLRAERLDDIEAIASRAEDLALHRGAEFAVVVARAVTSLPSLVELAAPLLSPGGHLVAYKGAPSDHELASGDEAAGIVGLRRAKERRYALPVLGERRVLLVYERVSEPSVLLPRRVGLAQKRPLA